VRVAELLVAVRQKLNKPEPGCNDGQPAKKYRHARTALHITAAITGDSATIKEVLKNRKMPDSPIRLPKEWHPGPYVGETRWLPWQGRTPSWQTAYNTARLFAALACNYSDPENEMAHRAVESLRSAVGDRHCEMERPSDWISKDPDLCCLKSSEFTKFLKKQTKKDYPPANPEPDHHRHLAHRDGARAGLAEATETGNFQQQQSGHELTRDKAAVSSGNCAAPSAGSVREHSRMVVRQALAVAAARLLTVERGEERGDVAG
jgi:hypothetical protein